MADQTNQPTPSPHRIESTGGDQKPLSNEYLDRIERAIHQCPCAGGSASSPFHCEGWSCRQAGSLLLEVRRLRLELARQKRERHAPAGTLFDRPAPAQSHSPTSKAAGERQTIPQRTRRTKEIVRAIRTSSGLTDEEGQEMLGISGNSYRPLRVNLVSAGVLADRGRRRRTRSGSLAIVWEATY